MLLACWPASWAQDFGVEGIRRRAQETVSRGRYQSKLEFEGQEKSPAWRPRPGLEPVVRESGGGSGTSELGRFGLYTVLVVVAVFIVLAFVGLLRDRARERAAASGKEGSRKPEVRPLPGGSGAPAESDLAEADRLAAAGRLEEAVHALLLEAIRILSLELGRPKASSTSRELLGLYALDDLRRRSFEALVLAVESALFGGRPLHREAYAACRGHFSLLAGRSLP